MKKEREFSTPEVPDGVVINNTRSYLDQLHDESDPKNLAAIILAAGKGSRMQATLPKVLQPIVDQPMIFYTLETLNKLGLSEVYVVVGQQSEEVRERISSEFDCKFAYQPKPLGTGHAVECALEELGDNAENILVLNGDDSAFYEIPTLEKFISSHFQSECPVSMMTLNINRERRLGRIIRDEAGNFKEIVEAEKNPDLGITSNEINCGLYVFNARWMRENIKNIVLSDKGEKYLTDIFNLAKKNGVGVNLFSLENENEWVGVNTPDELALANERMEKKLNQRSPFLREV